MLKKNMLRSVDKKKVAMTNLVRKKLVLLHHGNNTEKRRKT